ncbi:hypothetical protein HELRODRAFT_79842 [Helobdella robusta]|uniref:Uncharacterized protein n=1 Tax=Helobdella robusta TaxID=6412 RepID=T1G3U2_HELRO|nr:hypothetical protein HELRODRAFT_79842 [Helobdella robusta]ESO03699.1 hypothetical protein HELRODRAFT_79842 [Helobdella robusta]
MKDKVVIVTGANSGIGLELTKLLCLAGAKVIMGCRTLKKFEDAKTEILLEVATADVKFLQLNLSSFKSIRNFASEFLKSESKLDMLINNAGVLNSEADEQTEDGFNWEIQVNYLGHFLLTQLLLDILKKTPNILEHVFRNFNQLNNKDLVRGSAYSVSKLAMLLFTKELASIIGQNDPSVNAVNPGVVNSNLYNNLTFKKNPIMNIMIGPIFWFFVKPPRCGAQTALHCASNYDWLGGNRSGGNDTDVDGGNGAKRPTGKLFQLLLFIVLIFLYLFFFIFFLLLLLFS